MGEWKDKMTFDFKSKDSKPTIVFWVLRFLPPKTIGEGEVVAALAAPEWTLAKWKESNPDLFEKPGFYTLMQSTGETLTVDPEKEKKNG